MNSLNESDAFSAGSADANQLAGEPLLFWLFLIFNIPAVFLSLFVLTKLFKERPLRQALQNHIMMVIMSFNLIYQLFDIPLHLQYFYTGVIRPALPMVCRFWWFVDYGFYFLNLVLLMWSTFERHIIIFHSWLLATTAQRFFFHYLPICFIVLFILIFYAIALFAPPCVETFNFYIDLCGIGGCYGSITFFGMMERIVFSITPIFLIVVFSVALLLRVVRQKQRIQRAVDWRKQRKLTIHSILVSSLYLCFFYFSYFPILILPVICTIALPGLKIKVGRRQLGKTTRIGALDTLC